MKKINIWKEGSIIDLWSINHLLAGALLGGTFYFLDIALWKGLFLGISLMILWEFYEKIHGIKEALLNRIVDVIIGGLGLYGSFILSLKINIIISIILYIAMLVVWVILQKRGYTYLNKEYNVSK